VIVASVTDDLGGEIRFSHRERVVSLVPSLTEAIALTRRAALVGATDWCTHPADLDVARVRGTKNPDRARIIGLRPDLVIANREENRRTDVDALRAAGVPVWVTVIEDVPQALTSMRRLFADGLGWPVPDWLEAATQDWSAPPPPQRLRVAVPIWRDPWMVVGSRTFTGDLLARAGLANVFGGHDERYPHVSVADIETARPDMVLLPDEPYAFTPTDGPEAFTTRTALVEGRALTWYGPSLVSARAVLDAAIS
jgi:ABC-type Fe3+-hydroxamate transport system substrate-binding protein